MTEVWTSLKLIAWTSAYFERKGIPNPRLDAELLLAHILKSQRIDLYTHHAEAVSENHLKKYKEAIARRIQREPLQYIIGECSFWGLTIQTRPGVLIPRPETELMVEEALGMLKISPDSLPCPPSILDIATGSGCLAIALAKEFPESKILATDISTEALELARENVALHQLEKRVECLPADIAPWRTLKLQEKTFDLIVSNPPYIPSAKIEGLQVEVSKFEPRQALDGGEDGLLFYRKIFAEAPSFLKPGGKMILEIEDDRASDVLRLLDQGSSLTWLKTRKDYSGFERVVVLENRGPEAS